MIKENKIIFSLSLFIIVSFFIPVAYLITGSYILTIHTSEQISLSVFSKLKDAILNTFIFAIGGATLGMTLGFIYAWIVTRTNVPLKSLLRILPLLALSMPMLVKAFAWIYLFSPQIGIINILAKEILGIDVLFNIYSLPGMILAFGLGAVTLAYVIFEPVLASLDSSLEENARVCGGRLLTIFRRIIIPVIFPAILSVFILLLIGAIENLDYPLILGMPVKIYTLSTQVYYWLREYIPPNFGLAALTSIIYVVITFTLFYLYYRSTKKIFKYITVTGKMREKTLYNLGRWKYLVLTICMVIMIFSFFLPFSVVILMSFSASFQIYNFSFTLDNYVQLFKLPLLDQAVMNSLLFSFGAALSTTFIALLLSYSALRSKIKGSRIVEILSNIPLAFPGIVYGFALFLTFLLLPFLSYYIYGTLIPLIIALIFIRLPYSVRIISTNLLQLSPELEESSKVCGGSLFTTIRKILIPLLSKGMINSFLYTFINSLRELGAIILLVTPQSIVLITLLLQLYDQSAWALNVAAAGSVLLTMTVLVLLIIVLLINKKYEAY
jgi:iron(III) transport system permease protein